MTYLADRDAYQDSHVRTARFVDWRRLRAGCPTLADAAKGAEGNVYIYDWGDMLFATRAWFVLRCAGVRAHVVNGGWRAWMRMGGMVELGGGSEIEIVDRESGKKERNCISLREMKEIVQMKDKAEVILVDARSARQFSGVERRARRAGRIPGAVNVPFRRMLREDGGGMLETEQLRAVLTECGVLRGDDGTRFVAYCNGGVASTLVIFALIRCGVRFDRACNYCGSFNEWGNVTDTKVVSDA